MFVLLDRLPIVPVASSGAWDRLSQVGGAVLVIVAALGVLWIVSAVIVGLIEHETVSALGCFGIPVVIAAGEFVYWIVNGVIYWPWD
jgi:hypothetical protein